MNYQAVTQKLEAFLKRSASTAYAEPYSDLHGQITKQAWARVKAHMPPGPVKSVLDVGCGSGLALDIFIEEGYCAQGITCVEQEFRELNEKYPGRIFLQDMHDIGAWDQFWSLIWMRHIAEHSPAPAFLLSEAYDALRPRGYLYLEVPDPDTACGHDTILNCDHKSVMGKRMWSTLLQRAGFTIVDTFKFEFTVQAGADSYTGFLAKKG